MIWLSLLSNEMKHIIFQVISDFLHFFLKHAAAYKQLTYEQA